MKKKRNSEISGVAGILTRVFRLHVRRCFVFFPVADRKQFSKFLLTLKLFSHVWLSVTPWMVAHQYPVSLGFSRQEYWSRLPFSSPGALPDSNLGLTHYRQFLYRLTHWRSPLLTLIWQNLASWDSLIHLSNIYKAFVIPDIFLDAENTISLCSQEALSLLVGKVW